MTAILDPELGITLVHREDIDLNDVGRAQRVHEVLTEEFGLAFDSGFGVPFLRAGSEAVVETHRRKSGVPDVIFVTVPVTIGLTGADAMRFLNALGEAAS